MPVIPERELLMQVEDASGDIITETNNESLGLPCANGDNYGAVEQKKYDEEGVENNDATVHERPSYQRVGSISETFMEGMQEAAEAFVDEIQEVAEAVVEEIQEVADAFVDELQDADQGDTLSALFLDMSLARTLSILPGDLVDVAEASAPDPDVPTNISEDEVGGMDPEKQPFKPETTPEKPSIPLSAYLLFIAAIISLSSIGPLLNLQYDVDPVMKIFWRMSTTGMLLLPFAIQSLIEDGSPSLTISQMFMFILTAASYAGMCTSFVIALDYTTVGNASILANSQALILLLAKFFVGDTVLCAEASGAIVAFSGAALCSIDSADSSTEGGGKTIYGDFIAMIASICGVWYLVLAKTIRPHVSLHIFMFLTMSIGAFLVWLYMIVTDIEYSFSRHLTHGLWGWMNLEGDRLPLEMVMVIFCNFCGSMGYIRAMHYFDNVIISVAALLEPAVAELMASALGVGNLPGALGWLGNFMVAAGTFAVVFATQGKISGH